MSLLTRYGPWALITGASEGTGSAFARQLADAGMAEVAGDREVGLLIANAGADTNGSLFLDRDIADWDQLATMNVFTTMRNCHHFGQGMRARGRGGIIIVGSGAGYGGLHGLAVYCAAKAFALTFGEALRPVDIRDSHLCKIVIQAPFCRE